MTSLYWSADTYAPDPDGAWNVNFYDGNSLAFSLDVDFHVRLVRSGQ